jgi:4-hydroxybutyrate dehydrogenase
MAEFSIVPKIYYYDSVAQFKEAFDINERDLIVTRRELHDRYLLPLNINAYIIFRADYGKGEPSTEMIDRMAADIRRLDFDRIIALGGGSVIDICKILALDVPANSTDLFTGEVVPRKVKKLIAVPTTPGTGSEVTNVAVAELDNAGLKKGLAVPELYPDAAVLIPEVNDLLPYSTFKMSSVDMFITACESFLSPKATPYTDIFASEAIRALIPAYNILVTEGADARTKHMKTFVLASNYAGIAFGSASVGAVHALAYSIGGVFHVAHGESTYEFFIGVLKKYAEKNPNGKIRLLREILAQALNQPELDPFDALANLLGGIMEWKPLRSYGMTEAQIDEFTVSTIENQQRLLVNNYTDLSADDIRDVFQTLY